MDKFKSKEFYKRHKEFVKEKAKLKDWKLRLAKIYAEESPDHPGEKTQKTESKKVSRYHNEIKKFQEIQSSEEKKREDFLKKQREREEALAKYQVEQKRKKKMLYKKTPKGQPNMDSRMKLLLEKIQKQKE